MIRRFTILCCCAFIAFSGCRNSGSKDFDAGTLQSNLPPGMNTQTARLLNHYVSLKNALVEGNSGQAAEAARNMEAGAQELVRLDSTGILSKTATDSLQQSLQCILSARDESCERQRICFKPLSDALYSLLKHSGAKGVVLYHQYCPMAMNEHGAYWLSPSEKIENPYFGAKMLTCGEVVDTLR